MKMGVAVAEDKVPNNGTTGKPRSKSEKPKLKTQKSKTGNARKFSRPALPPQPVCILKPCSNHTFQLDNKALESILLQDGVRDKKVAVISVAGAFRKGKSFLLDFLLRYLGASGADGWMGGEDEELTGFSWRGGAERETTGVLMWSQPFIMADSDGDNIAVLVMDTQGAFDSHSTVKDCATIFALSTMMSSVQIFNISQNLQEDHLQHLQLFTEYGRIAAEEEEEGEGVITTDISKPFQRLEFLIRDWSYPYEHPYGDGEVFLEKRLAAHVPGQHEELRETRQHVRRCFDRVGCFLMPHPGKVVATDPRFKGQLKHLDGEFRDSLAEFVPRLLSPANIQVKRINGSAVTSSALLHYVKSYVEIFQGGELPEPRSILHATAEANNMAALAIAKERYQRDMELFCGGGTPYMSPGELEKKSGVLRYKAQTLFTGTPRMGGPGMREEYSSRLDEQLDRIYENFVKINEGKDLLHTFRTPLVYLLVLFLAHITSGCLNLVGLCGLAGLCSVVFGASLLAVFGWVYVRLSGEMREMGEHLDVVADWIWKEVVVNVHAYVMKNSGESAIVDNVLKLRKLT